MATMTHPAAPVNDDIRLHVPPFTAAELRAAGERSSCALPGLPRRPGVLPRRLAGGLG